MTLIGYISDEHYLAIPDALVEFIDKQGNSTEVRSRASGSVHADLPSGIYQVVLAKHGYGAKRVQLTLPRSKPYHFRLLLDRLLGYAWPKALRGEEQSEFRIHSSEAYSLSLWHYGLEKNLVRPIGWYDEHGPRATVQVSPDGDYSQTGIAWNTVGYTSPDHKQFISAPERTGLYYFHAKGESGAFFSFPWVVAPAKPTAKIAVICSDLNWTAYNNFGGRSNYIHPQGLPPTPTVSARSELLRYTDGTTASYVVTEKPLRQSLDRPELINLVPEDALVNDPIEGRAANHVAPAEWRLLAWLEREGFNYDLYSETQLHGGILDLDRYQVLALGPHPEYWTATMYYTVKSWVYNRGGRLVYLGGNGMNAEVELFDDATIAVHNFPPEFLLERGLSSRFHARQEAEAALLGVMYDTRGIMTAAPYEVRDDSHWVFQDTGLTNGQWFGTKSQHMRIPGGASGHETDKISALHSPKNTVLLAKGLNPNDGGAEMAVYETPSGGAVFAAGSICYVSSLLWDEGVSKVTANVLRRFMR